MTSAYQHQTTITAAGIRIAYIPRSEGALVQITLDGVTHGRFFNSHGHAHDVYRELVKAHTAPLNVGEQHAESVDRTVVTVQRVASGVWSVVTYTGSYRNESWCRSYPTQAEADRARIHTLAAFAAHGSADAIQARADELAPQLWQAATRRGPAARNLTLKLQREAWALATLAERAQLADIAQHIAA